MWARALELPQRTVLDKETLDRKSGSAGMPRPISYAVFCLKKQVRGRRPAAPRPSASLGRPPRTARPAARPHCSGRAPWWALRCREGRLPWVWFPVFFNDTATTEIYTLSLHDALPIWGIEHEHQRLLARLCRHPTASPRSSLVIDRKSGSAGMPRPIAYAVFCFYKEGIQDEILTRLSKIADLKVISRTATQYYKSAPENLSSIVFFYGYAHHRDLRFFPTRRFSD